jgi:LDH2 family malate/lactate/ureidoglycolate dehydrogenase
MRVSQMFLGIDISRFLTPDEFARRMESPMTVVKSAPPSKG